VFTELLKKIIQKIVAGRPRDLADAKTVILKNAEFDRGLVRHWLQQFDQELDTGFLQVFEQVLEKHA
jgi:hypothetical protein